MTDVIQLLPDSIANQIAAGEVIQRPASVVKELVENAIDAGSTNIKLIVKDAGKSLIQVIDNGCGMSETDARMCFERHATSKIREASDLFSIRTMGFRGEAMPSIAAIAQVELKTRRNIDEVGTKIQIEGSTIVKHEACQTSVGTSISVKNLFYNIPARRNFLKTNAVEMRHIIDEFQRIALANPEVFFSLHHNRVELFHLPSSNMRQRIVGVFGGNTNKKLVPVSEETDILKINGFVGKPEFAKKTRGEQFFFVNNRFIKSGYLNHSIMGAYEEVLQKDTFPFYVIFIDIEPSLIDINVHPTKQEIKFEDERLVYNYLKVSVRHALGQYSVMPTIDFNQEINFSNFGLNTPRAKDFEFDSDTKPKRTSSLNPEKTALFPSEAEAIRHRNNNINWEKLYEGLDDFEIKKEDQRTEPFTIESEWTAQGTLDDTEKNFTKKRKEPYQIHNTYIVSQIKSGFLLIDQQTAHERILYERFLKSLENQEILTQKSLFPKTINLSISDAEVLKPILPEINLLGFDVQEFGQETFVVHGIPAVLKHLDEQAAIENIIEQYKNGVELNANVHENVARSLAISSSIRRGQRLEVSEMQHLIDELFACEIPFKGIKGQSCFVTYDLDDLENRFK
jgi:DNA mismatch repair protein MutL